VARAHAPVPKRAPTPAVSPIASAPQKVTRRAPTVTRAPPTRAATPPRSTRQARDAPETTGISCGLRDEGGDQERQGSAPREAAGYWTIGVGHLIRPGEHFDEPLLGDAAEKLFQQDLKPKAAAVNTRVSVPLFQGQFDAVLSWTYNLGEGALKSSTMLKKINAVRHEDVPAQIKRWNKAGGKVVKGLERRREAEAELYRMRWY
jgi:lysozyme